MNKQHQKPGFFPWWLSIILAAACYYGLTYIVPGLLTANSAMYQIFQAAPTLAPIIAIVFLLLGAKQLYDQDTGKTRNKNTHGHENHLKKSDKQTDEHN